MKQFECKNCGVTKWHQAVLYCHRQGYCSIKCMDRGAAQSVRERPAETAAELSQRMAAKKNAKKRR